MRFLFPHFIGGFGALGLLVVRLVVGVAFVFHGLGKFGKDPTAWMGDAMPGYLQFAAALIEVAGGIMLGLGLITPLAALALGGVMVGAVLYHLSNNDPFVGAGGPSYELAAVYLAISFMYLIAGPGKLSIDYALFGRKPVHPS